MSTLWTFGDSFTYGYGCRYTNNSSGGEKEYFEEYYKEGLDIWPNHLSKFLEMNLQNFGENGYSNWDILDKIIEQSKNIKKDDIVVIFRTDYQRNRYPHNNRWIYPFKEDMKKEEYHSVVDFQYYFAKDKLYKKRQNLYFEYISNTLYQMNKVKTVLISHPWKFKNIETIRKHTKNKIDDSHPSFNGHLELAHLFYETITNKSKRRKI